jgi:hypothetical protein
MILICGLVTALATAALTIVRLIECIYELRKTPELSTFQKLIQIVKNFFTIERYQS